MPSLKEYRNRIVSVESTRKIASAMKMVGVSKLKKALDEAIEKDMNAFLASFTKRFGGVEAKVAEQY